MFRVRARNATLKAHQDLPMIMYLNVTLVKMMFKSSICIGAGLMVMGAIATTIPLNAQPVHLAQDVRLPIASVDPNQPIQIRIVSQSDLTLVVALNEPTSTERSLPPRETITFGSLNASYLPLPIDLTAYIETSDTSLNWDVTVVGNEIVVTVTTATGFSGAGRALRVDEGGNIYIY